MWALRGLWLTFGPATQPPPYHLLSTTHGNLYLNLCRNDLALQVLQGGTGCSGQCHSWCWWGGGRSWCCGYYGTSSCRDGTQGWSRGWGSLSWGGWVTETPSLPLVAAALHESEDMGMVILAGGSWPGRARRLARPLCQD